MSLTDGSQDANGRQATPGPQRLDKWLWFARVVKSRTQAAVLVTQGKFKVNKVRAVKPSQTVKAGDIITSTAQKWVRVLRVKAPGERRGPASEAAALYEELTERPVRPMSEGENYSAGAPAGHRPKGFGRPTKRDRRKIDRLLDSH